MEKCIKCGGEMFLSDFVFKDQGKEYQPGRCTKCGYEYDVEVNKEYDEIKINHTKYS